MKILLKMFTVAAVMGLASQTAYAKPDHAENSGKHDKVHKQDKKDKRDSDYHYDRDGDRYADSSLPPGLQKRAQNTGKPLPPGWQKKLRRGDIMDRDIYRHGKVIEPVDVRGVVTVSIDGKMVRLYQATREIIDILN
ncbi:hypothetical protein [Thiomicrorhabdus sp. 6S3-12]|uniref:hypothetical protein n=1 Tax=Thiomicrorhabdus sp. 6S3-12 TaxID=2819681 RepID=UPI001AAE104B|nr:hypothetical protein [Thiomicrorhabdus sp. 6S3-12]MBO1924802.1 hypothetical protein [Thiomicrorhabdus sp. 6S3-12]